MIDRERPKHFPQLIYSSKAHSIAAYAYLQEFLGEHIARIHVMADAMMYPLQRPEARLGDPVDSLILAAEHANTAACLNFLSYAVLFAGFAFRDVCTDQLRIDPWKIKHFAPLWQALEQYERVTYDKMHPEGWQYAHRARTRCAAPGCTGTTRLIPCPGNCTFSNKVWYCNETCQKRGWEYHRDACRPPLLDKPLYALTPNAFEWDRGAQETVWRFVTSWTSVTQLEVERHAVNKADTRNGITIERWEFHHPFNPGQKTRFVLKRYD
ncbi:hypothetical protein C8Q77DRAFT_1160050 [Trametes polyzona]|nr:hypothetical protein C8Q77DRAFT_1160050 [Trametes polyzona]